MNRDRGVLVTRFPDRESGVGARITAYVDPARYHVFAESGAAI